MGKYEMLCPFCGREKFKIITHKNTEEFKKLKGGNFYRPTLTRAENSQWNEDPNRGLGIQCKCGKYFFLTGFGDVSTKYTVHKTLPEGHSFVIYCDSCGKAFASKDLLCPTCGN